MLSELEPRYYICLFDITDHVLACRVKCGAKITSRRRITHDFKKKRCVPIDSYAMKLDST